MENKNKKKTLIIFFILITLSLVIFALNNLKITTVESSSGKINKNLAPATNTVYKDWSSIKMIEEDYSYSTIYYSSDTEITLIKNDGTETWDTVNEIKTPYVELHTGQEMILLITNCAVNRNGQTCDVVVKINNVKEWEVDESDRIYFHFMNDRFLNSQLAPVASTGGGQDYIRERDVGEIISFELGAKYADCDFSITYYVAGTYKYDSTKNEESGTLAGITSTNNFVYDIDVPGVDGYESQFLKGYEGLRPNVGSSTIYYNKDLKHDTYTAILSELDNGIACSQTDFNTNGIWYQNSAFVTTSGINNSTYNFTYGGQNCAITYSFMSPYPYSMSKPTKTVSTETVSEKEIFYYAISQYVPNNYYGSLIKYNEIYSTLYSDTHYTNLSIKDTLDSNLELRGDIKIINEKKEDVTSYFDITTSNNVVTATVKEAVLGKVDFYAHKYIMNISVYLKEGSGSNLTTTSQIKNIAKTTNTLGNDTTTLESNEVNSTLIYMVSTLISHGKITEACKVNIHEDKEVEFTPDENYYVSSVKVDGEEQDITEYINGGKITFTNIITDHAVEVVCSKIKPKVVVQTSIKNGTITEGSTTEVEYGEDNTVTITIKPHDNYELKSVTVDGENYDISNLVKNSDNTYTLTIEDKEIQTDIEHSVIAECVAIVEDTTIAKDILPNTGITGIIMIAIIITSIMGIIMYKAYKKQDF